MHTAISSWGIELCLLRTTVGREFEIIQRLRRTNQAPGAHFFGVYGYFDLAAVRCIDDLSTASLLPLDTDIIEASPFRFFADNANKSKVNFDKSLSKWETAVAIFFKISPEIFLRAPNDIRSNAAKKLRNAFPEGYVFFGLGFSEILILVGGPDLSQLLKRVSTFRQTQQSDSILRKLLVKTPSDTFFVKTATFPFVSYNNVHRSSRHRTLKGEIYPVVTLSCDPSSEDNIIKMLPKDTEVRNSYGDTDLIIYWKEQKIPFARFAAELTKIRQLAKSNASIRKTTSYLETAPLANSSGLGFPLSAAKAAATSEAAKGLIPSEILKLINSIEPASLRASITDLWLRLFSCLSDAHLESAYYDMANTFPYMLSLLADVSTLNPVSSEVRRNEAKFLLSLLCDLARIAINQRYAGLETHPETLAHSQSPVLSDIRSMVSAASCVPQFIFDNLFPTPGKAWSGYVIFGTTYSHQWYPQDILALPATAIYDPVSEWWKTTHEAAHAVYRLLEVSKRIDKELFEYVNHAYDDSTVSTDHVLGEVFANWFDWRYIFNCDTALFLEMVWNSWIQLPVVRHKKSQYLIRTFIIYLAQDLSNFHAASESESQSEFNAYMNSRWASYVRVISRHVPSFKSFVAELQGNEMYDVFRQSGVLVSAVYFYNSKLESSCHVLGLGRRLNPSYARLQAHLNKLERGEVVTERITNPCKVQIELLRRTKRRPTSLATQGAFVLSLENTYLLNRI